MVQGVVGVWTGIQFRANTIPGRWVSRAVRTSASHTIINPESGSVKLILPTPVIPGHTPWWGWPPQDQVGMAWPGNRRQEVVVVVGARSQCGAALHHSSGRLSDSNQFDTLLVWPHTRPLWPDIRPMWPDTWPHPSRTP